MMKSGTLWSELGRHLDVGCGFSRGARTTWVLVDGVETEKVVDCQSHDQQHPDSWEPGERHEENNAVDGSDHNVEQGDKHGGQEQLVGFLLVDGIHYKAIDHDVSKTPDNGPDKLTQINASNEEGYKVDNPDDAEARWEPFDSSGGVEAAESLQSRNLGHSHSDGSLVEVNQAI